MIDIPSLAHRTGFPAEEIRSLADDLHALAKALGLNVVDACYALVGASQTPASAPRNGPNEPDGRTSSWFVRLRLYHAGELEADTDDERTLSEPGVTIVHGLPGVAVWAAGVLALYHQADAPEPWAHMFLAARIPSLRVLIGRARVRRQQPLVEWRVPYTIPSGEWVAAITLLQCGEAQSAAARRLTR